ncbi:bacterioferritin-associated ferredoxin [Ancylobacter aquaticus]|uniref:Bacterioferritin-associated ferredoxin n=1 Tax=Ancylobacter aquaticus TaxID=100 RepID=A0A4R1I846_ANCAQ|nr:(2Fe-2S)-binding protein [Ancylobacter aquaticus]TCK31188.1 bacterioferritin-associated ferredoxin [Ancylobacter aquaticus]
MIVCSCNVLSDRQIRSAVTETPASVRTVGQVYRCLGCSAQCGRCARTIRKLLDDVNASACGSCPLDCPVSAQAPGQPAQPHGGHSHVGHGHATHSQTEPAYGGHGEHFHPHAQNHAHAHGEQGHAHSNGRHTRTPRRLVPGDHPRRAHLGHAVAAE